MIRGRGQTYIFCCLNYFSRYKTVENYFSFLVDGRLWFRFSFSIIILFIRDSNFIRVVDFITVIRRVFNILIFALVITFRSFPFVLVWLCASAIVSNAFIYLTMKNYFLFILMHILTLLSSKTSFSVMNYKMLIIISFGITNHYWISLSLNLKRFKM